jgi:uncharacterized protein with beta-barrel porin domain
MFDRKFERRRERRLSASSWIGASLIGAMFASALAFSAPASAQTAGGSGGNGDNSSSPPSNNGAAGGSGPNGARGSDAYYRNAMFELSGAGGGGGGAGGGAGGAGGLGSDSTTTPVGGAGGSAPGQPGAPGSAGAQNSGGGGGGGGAHGAVATTGTYSNATALTGGSGGNGGNGGNEGVGQYIGGGGGGGAGGYGLVVNGATSVSNSGSIAGGSGGNGGSGVNGGNGGDGGVGVYSAAGITLTNSGSISGGVGGAGGAAMNGDNYGTGRAGRGGAGGVGIYGSNLTITNSGSISGGVSGDGATQANAIIFTGGVNSLTLLAGSTISGHVVAVSGGSDSFALGGSSNSSFDASLLGVQYQNFASYLKIGTSNWTLTGTNAAAMAWTIDGGTLEVDAAMANSSMTVDASGALAGVGAVGATTINSGGTLAPGASGVAGGVLTVNGNLTMSAGSDYAIAISPTLASKTQVNGAATLGGATVVVTPLLGTYAPRKYTILTATDALGSGNIFSPTVTVTKSGVIADPTLSYDANDVYLLIDGYLNTLTLPANAPLNAQNAANAINAFIVAGGAPPAGFQPLAGLSGAALNAAVNQLAGQSQGSFAPVGFEAGDLFLNLMLNPHVEGRSAFGDLVPMAYAPGPATPAAFSALAPPRAAFAPQMQLWAAAYGAGGTIAGDAATGAARARSSIYGFAGGVDYHIRPNAVVGFALGGGGANWGLDGGMGGGRSDLFQAGVYGVTQSGPIDLSAALAYSWHGATTTRTPSLGGGALTGAFDANVFSGRLEAGYRLPVGAGFTLTPYVADQAQAMILPAFAESSAGGASDLALGYASRTFTTNRVELGARLDDDLAFGPDRLRLYSRLAWGHDFNNEGTTTAFFQSLSGATFLVNAAKPALDNALVTAGLEYKLAGGWSLNGKFDGEFSRTTSIYSATGQIQKMW